jgi:hypothetical protein
MMTRFAVLAAVAVGLVGCGTTGGGAWDASGYTQHVYGWNAAYPAGQQALLGPEWQLDNWKKGDDGTLEEKTGGRYSAMSEEDEDGDGVVSPAEKKEVVLYDLKFLNARDNGVIWIQTRPVSPANERRDLDVLVENYADSLVGSGLYEQGTLFGTAKAMARSFTTFVKDKNATRLGPHRAVAASIEVAETERLRGDPQSRLAMIRIVVTKFKYRAEVASLSSGIPDLNGTQATPVKRYEDRTAVMLIGYANDPARFASGLPSFEALVTLLRWPRPMLVPEDAQQTPPPAPATAPAPPAAPDVTPAAPVPAAPPSAT